MNQARSNLTRFLLALTLTAALLPGCQSAAPRVSEVSHRTVVSTIGAGDEALFEHDRASRIAVTPQLLPAAERREEFRIRWTTATIATVKLQYRQVNLPNEIREQTFVATGKRTTLFRIHGENFVTGGPVSAWRVSLWSEANSCVAEKQSATW